jgi:anti-anti-sigma factor
MSATSEPKPAPPSEPYLSFRRHGEMAVVTVSSSVEDLPPNVVEMAAQVVLSPLKENPPSNVIIDLSRVKYFTSEFISFLLRCHVIVKKHHGELVLAGVSDKVRELLRQTALDTLWAIYDNRSQALEALGGAD